MIDFAPEPSLEIIPKLFISNAEVIEGNYFNEQESNPFLEFKVTLDRPAKESVFVMMEASGYLPNEYDYYLPKDVADWEDMYYMTMESLIFKPGETEKTFRVAVYPDLEIENNEEVFATVSYFDGNVEIADGLGIGTIINDDFAQPNQISTSEISPKYRINVGGKQIADALMNWSEDTNSNPSPYRVGSGGAKIYGNNSNIALEDESLTDNLPQEIFQTERWDPLTGQNMQWSFEVAPGNYEIRLYFAEIYNRINDIGKRVFDVKIEDSIPEIFSDIDVFADVGYKSALTLSYTTTILDGELDLEFIHNIQNPALKGIEILSVSE